MAENTKIQWATHTFNPWRGCAKIAEGCANCYADAQSKRNPGTLGVWGPNGTRVLASESMWRQPVKWDRYAEIAAKAWSDTVREVESISAEDGEAYLIDVGLTKPELLRVFCASLADVFEEWRGVMRDSNGNELAVCRGCGHVSWGSIDCGGGEPLCSGVPKPYTLDDARARLCDTIDATQNLIWMLLSKRIENARRMLAIPANGRDPSDPLYMRRDNLWLGISIACRADMENAADLAKCRDLCRNTFWSLEPLVDDLGQLFPPCKHCEYGCQDPETGLVECGHCECTGLDMSNAPDWVIVGGESGPHARPCNVDWVRSIVQQCKDAGVACFVKQLGAACMDDDGESRCEWPGLTQFVQVTEGCKVKLIDHKGADPSEWPEDLRVREVPQ